MINQNDVADEQIKGLARYFPTTLAKTLLAATITAPVPIFQLVRSNAAWFLIQDRTPLEQTLIAAVAALIASLAISLILSLELAHIISTRKHRRIVHFSNEHPHMSFRWLLANARSSHLFISCCMLAISFGLGYAIRI